MKPLSYVPTPQLRCPSRREAAPSRFSDRGYSVRDIVDIKRLVRPQQSGAGAARDRGDPFGDDLERQAAFLDYLWSENFTWDDPLAQGKLQRHFAVFEERSELTLFAVFLPERASASW
ncbi:MAG TPA: hypothetical protein VMU56_06720 [Beijerinckiaceae bacterium]|nr:hypothetical protein [Beijerinckiaceae bacterium]HVB89761.1 hypothetical protein [Beijerinckiaceae bacterium]